jgi:uncharacterized protein (DUF305 family)
MTTSTPVEERATRKAPPPAGPLPWRLPWTRTIALIAVLCFAAGVIGWYIGRPENASYSNVDKGFLADMSAHHSGAINLAFTYLPNGQDATLLSIAREIITDQSQEIGTMNGLLERAGNPSTVNDGISMDWMGHPVPTSEMPGLATKAQFDALGAAHGLAADDQFSRLMIIHHEAGVEMADFAARYGENSAVRRLAAAMAKAQKFEISEMNLRRQTLGLAVVNPGRLVPSHAP